MIFLALLLQSTSCTTYGNMTNCQTQGGLNLPPPVMQTDSGGLDGDALQSLAANVRTKKARGRQKKVGKLIAAGDCQGAVAYALDKGDLPLADYARSYCAR